MTSLSLADRLCAMLTGLIKRHSQDGGRDTCGAARQSSSTEIARLAWNIGKWLAQLVLPNEVARWEWKRFRLHFVLVPAQLMGVRASDVGAPHGRALDHRPARTRLRRFVTLVSCCRRTTRPRESVQRTAVFARREISH